MSTRWNNNLKQYDQLVDQLPEIQRKGKTMPYTSANGHMFSLLNKQGELGIRIGKEAAEQFMAKHNSSRFKSHGSFLRGYVLIPDTLLEDKESMLALLRQAHSYVLSLTPK